MLGWKPGAWKGLTVEAAGEAKAGASGVAKAGASGVAAAVAKRFGVFVFAVVRVDVVVVVGTGAV